MTRYNAADNPIEYLVERRFPNHEVIVRLPSYIDGLSRSGTITSEGRGQLSAAVEKYRAELQAMARDELRVLAAKAQAEEVEMWRAKLEKEERERFFHQSYAAADFDHWSRATYWTLDEAVSLAFGKSPEVVNWQKVQPLVNVSAFAKQFARVRDLVSRAKNWQQLYDPAMPGFFLAWARRNEIAVPEELFKAVEARGVVVADWKDAHDNLKTQFDTLLEDRNKLADIDRRLIEERDSLQARLAELEEQATTVLFNKRESSPRNENANLRIIAAMLALLRDRDGARFPSDATVIDVLVDKYGAADGVSKSNLEKVFPAAKRVAGDDLKPKDKHPK